MKLFDLRFSAADKNRSSLFRSGGEAPALRLLDGCEPIHPVTAEKEIHELLDTAQTIRATELSTWVDQLTSAGVRADRRTSPSLANQLDKTLTRPIDTVMCNLLDGDASMRLSALLAMLFAPQLLAGIVLLARVNGAGRTWIVSDSTAPNSWTSALRRLARQHRVRFIAMRNDYPQSDPTLLLYGLAKRKLRPNRLPVEQGVLMIDAAAAIAVGNFLLTKKPVRQVPVALRDHGRRESHFLLVPHGMPLRDVLTKLHIPTDGLTLRGGDVLRDQRMSPDLVIDGNSELAIHATFNEPPTNPQPCIRCGWCAEGCPTRLQPAGILEAAQRGDRAMGEKFGLEACIECGICSYVCPSYLPLLEGVRKLRSNGVTA
jgi:electron transport complex protein RnfC